ncbi:MAG: M20/M25/M40 family metallo-hydrolase [Thermoplasmata archaeon]|nr:MAG: M20/M25/M40 family metallo-hydrolase [Thermoplasmata archaeon]
MDVLELTKNLISIESVTGNEHAIAEFIASQLDFTEVKMQSIRGFGPNVIVRHITDPEKACIILNCHMDTVEVMQGWTSDPLKPRTEGNRLFGLGACDMKAGIAIAVDAFKYAVNRDMNLIFTAVSDEEGNSKGSHVLIEQLIKRDFKEHLKDGLCIIPEDTQENVKLGARGRYVIEINVTGRSSHGATPKSGTNAIEDAAQIVGALNKLPLNSHSKLGEGTICALKIEGGGNSLSVPDKCTIRVDRHTVMGESKKQIKNDFEELLKTMDIKSSYEISFMKRETPFLEPYILEENDPWAIKFKSVYRKLYEKEPDIVYGKSVGDFNAFGKIMPTIVFGPKGENLHGPNECVYIDSIERCRNFYLKFLDSIKGIG